MKSSSRNRLYRIALVASSALLLSVNVGKAQSDLTEEVTALETKVLGTAPPSESVSQRMDAIETRLFGHPQEGGLFSRLNNARTAQNQASEKQQSQGSEKQSPNQSLKGEIQQTGGTSGTALKGGAAQGTKKPLSGTIKETGVLPGYIGKTAVPQIKLSPEEYKEALQQYNADLKDFVMSASQYSAAVKQYDLDVGACNENNQQYAAKVKQQQLNISAIQIPTIPINIKQFDVPPVIPPPRVCCAKCIITGRCGHLGTGGGPAGNPQAAQNAMRMDAIRVNESQNKLGAAQQSLKVSEAEQGFAEQKATQEADLEAKMQKLADKFGQLQEKFNIVKIERDTLTGSVKK